jgi:hypothetical protein
MIALLSIHFFGGGYQAVISDGSRRRPAKLRRKWRVVRKPGVEKPRDFFSRDERRFRVSDGLVLKNLGGFSTNRMKTDFCSADLRRDRRAGGTEYKEHGGSFKN